MNAYQINNGDQRKVLGHYAGGKDIVDIAKATGLPQELVSGTVQTIAGFDRGRARLAVQDYDQRRMTAAVAGLEAAAAAARSNGQPAVTVQKPAPAMAPPAARTADVNKLDTDTLLILGQKSDNTRVARLADRIRANVNDLRQLLADEQKAADARAKVEAAKAAYEQALAELAAATGKTKPAAPAPAKRSTPPDVEPKEVRRWAAENRVHVSPQGRIPQHIVDQYLAAQAGEAA